MSLESFNRAVRNFARDLVPSELVKLQKRISLQALTSIVLRTPVDTGRARGNWQTSINAPEESESFSESPIPDGTAVIETVGPFEAVYIVNNVPYIIYLEDGSSQQAPAGMVSVTLAELEEAFV